MKISPIKRTSALLAAMAIVLSYTVFPDTVIRSVYASGSQSSSASADTFKTSAPTVASHPQDVTAKPDEAVTFTVSANGAGRLKYQWYYKKAEASDWTVWNGRTTASITPTSNSSWNMMQVRCLVTDDNGSVYSNPATITIDQPLTILTQPKNITVKADTPVTLSVKAQGKGALQYQWYYKKAGASDWVVWKGRTTASVTPSSNSSWNMMKVKCNVTDDNGNVFSNAATIKIDQPLTILTQPDDVTAKAGQTVTFSVKAQGKGALKYQWYYKKAGASDWTLWNGRTTASITPTANSSWNMMKVKCNVTDDNGNVFSGASTVKIDQPLTVLTQPDDVTTKVGQAVTFSVKAQGKGALKYQWYYKKAGASDWTIWNGRTAASISPVSNSSWHLMQVRCMVSDDSRSVFSDAAIITLDLPLSVLTQPNNVTVKPGESVKFSVKAQGNGTLSYQWYYKKADADDWAIWNGRTTASITPTSNSSWNMMQVRCMVSNGADSIYSDAATITIDQPLVILTQPDNITEKPGTNVVCSVKAQGKGTLKYQWYYKEASAENWTVWEDHTTANITFEIDSTWNMKQVRCMVTDDAGSIYSDTATVKIDQPLVILTQPEDVTVKVGSQVKMTVKAQGKGALKYQWHVKKADADSWTIWYGCTSPSISLTSIPNWNMMQMRCLVTDDSGSIFSKTVVVTISQPLKIISVSQPKYIFPDYDESVIIDVKAQGTGVLKYQWYYKNIDATSWTLWSPKKTASASLYIGPTWNKKQVQCVITDAAGNTAKTDPVIVITPAKIFITKQPQKTSAESGKTAKLSVSVQGQNTLSYQWYYKKAGKTNWTTWTGKNTSTISATVDHTWNGAQVYCKITDNKNNSVNSNPAQVTINKQSDKRYFSRTITVKKNSTKIYSGIGTGTSVVGTVSANSTFTVTEWDSDSSDTTWYSFNYNGKKVWIPRTSVNSSISYTSIPDRKYNEGGMPVIYLSPSRQGANLYAVGNTTEQEQMYRVANTLKTILEDEYYCSVYIPPASMKLGLNNRAYDAFTRNSDVYLAIHSNSISNGIKMHGATGFYFPACNQSYQLAQNIVNEMGKIEFQKSIVKNKLVNGMTAYENTGYGEVRDPSYYGIISVLAEVEYHHYEAPARWIINNNDKIARALANSLADTLEMQKK